MATPDSSSSSSKDTDHDRAIFLEAIAGRKPTMADLIGQAGGNFLKGESPVPRLVQQKAEIKRYLNDHFNDPEGALLYVLQNCVEEADRLISRYGQETPLLALQNLVESFLGNTSLLAEIVRQADFRWGQIYDERPLFNRPGQADDPDDPYTLQSVQQQLKDLLLKIQVTI